MSELTRFGVSINQNILGAFDKLIEKEGYANRSAAIKNLIYEKLLLAEEKNDNKEVIGTITLVYNHHYSDISENLTQTQHEYHKSVISTTHVHLDEHNCLEVLIVKGKCGDIKKIADKLIHTRGVRHGKLAVASSGEDL